MLAFNHSLLKGEYILVNVWKSVASIIFTCNLHEIFLLKITLRYFSIIGGGIFDLI
jgi:hypothetical protein